jgi:hypothetical protein
MAVWANLGCTSPRNATKMLASVLFTLPPFPLPTVTTAANNFNTAVAASVHGMPANTLNKYNLRTVLLRMLNQLATYVELVANNDPVKILASDFSLTSTVRTPLAPGLTSISAVTNVASGKLELTLAVAENAHAYIVEYAMLPNGAAQTKTITDPHEVVLTGLTPGTNYFIRVRVMGSGNQETEFCEPVTHMST